MLRALAIAASLLATASSPTPVHAFAPDRDTPLRMPGQGIPGGLDGRGIGLPQQDEPTDAVDPDFPDLLDGGEDADADRTRIGPPPPVGYGDSGLPEPVRRTRAEIMEAARSGDPEALRPIVERAVPPTVLANIPDTDPIDVLRIQSGDEAGREILAIMLDVLDTGWVRLDEGTPRERYVWPYFAAFDPEKLDARQQVELFRLLTASDFEEMRIAGAYVFYRVEIAPDGRWQAFVAGE